MKAHCLRLYLDSPLYLKLIQFQATKKLGRSFAGLLIFIEGMKSLDLIDEDTYEYYKRRYDKPLEDSPIKVQVVKPRCFLCGRDAETDVVAVSIQTGKKYSVCRKHLEELKEHPRWSIVSAAATAAFATASWLGGGSDV